MFVPIVFVAPLWVALLSLLLFRAPPPRGPLACFRPSSSVWGSWSASRAAPVGDMVGVALALAASFLFGVVFLTLELLVATDRPARAVAREMLVAAGLAGTFQGPVVVSQLSVSPNFRYALAVGAITAVSLVLLASGIVRTGAFRAAVIAGAEPLAAALLGWLLLREVVSALQLIGGLVVVAGVVGASGGPHER